MLLKKIVITLFITLIFVSCNHFDNYLNGTNSNQVDGLSARINLNEIPELRGHSKDILNGYNTIEELSNDLDRIGLNAGLKYIEDYNNVVYCIEEDGVAIDTQKSDYETNNQVSGVDEADISKSDGSFIYTIYGKELVILNLDGIVVSRTSIFNDFEIQGILLKGNKIVAFSHDYSVGSELAILEHNQGTILSVTKKKLNLFVTDMRMHNNRILIFADTDLSLWEMYEKLFDHCSNSYFKEITENDREIAKEKLTTEIPKWRNKLLQTLFSENGEVDLKRVKNTLKMFKPIESDSNKEHDYEYNSYVELISFNLNEGFNNIKKTGAFTSGWGNTIYTDGEVSVISSQGWGLWSGFGWNNTSYLTTFVTDDNGSSAKATSQINGSILNQFSMDYYNGYLRVGVSTGSWDNSKNSLVVLDINNLKEVGRLDDLGIGETIHSMRFDKDRAYMVTFRQTDPFYTLDLSDPFNPKKAGELKVNGYSGYIHPIDNNTLLTVGMDATDMGIITGFQVSLYDVTNFSSPVRLLNKTLKGSWSSTLWDHHAFRYIDSKNALVLPLSTYSYTTDKFTIFNIDRDSGISIKGEITHNSSSMYEWYSKPRSMLIDNNIITIKGKQIKSSSYSDLTENWVLEF